MMYGDAVKVGDRVALHPATDLWMQGDRHGVVARVVTGQTWCVVSLDSGRSRRVSFADLALVAS